jgi:hypothetical protein
MKLTVRTIALGTVLSVFTAAGLLVYPAFAEETAADIWTVIECQNQMADAERQMRERQCEDEVVLERIAMRREVIHDVVAGRLTFEEASLRFAELNRGHAAALNYVRRAFPGQSDEERAAWQLASHMRRSGDPAAQALGEELECILTSRL